MTEPSWEDALEAVVGFLDAPPHPDSEQGRRFDEALLRVLAGAPSVSADNDEPRIELDPSLRRRLDDLAKRRAGGNPFGVHPDGIGPTLGMDLGPSSREQGD